MYFTWPVENFIGPIALDFIYDISLMSHSRFENSMCVTCKFCVFSMHIYITMVQLKAIVLKIKTGEYHGTVQSTP